LRDQEKGWINETVRLQKKLEDAENAGAKKTKGQADVEEDLKERLRACEKLVDELQDRVKEGEKNGVAAAAGEWRGREREGKSSRRRRGKNGPKKWLRFSRNIVRPRRERGWQLNRRGHYRGSCAN
jgi:hypothetical protein